MKILNSIRKIVYIALNGNQNPSKKDKIYGISAAVIFTILFSYGYFKSYSYCLITHNSRLYLILFILLLHIYSVLFMGALNYTGINNKT